MKQSVHLKELIKNKQIKILTIYPDEDLTLWKKHLNKLSTEWINGYDKGQILTLKNLYDLSTIPSFYLLDKEKKVLLKDADWKEIVHFFAK